MILPFRCYNILEITNIVYSIVNNFFPPNTMIRSRRSLDFSYFIWNNRPSHFSGSRFCASLGPACNFGATVWSMFDALKTHASHWSVGVNVAALTRMRRKTHPCMSLPWLRLITFSDFSLSLTETSATSRQGRNPF